MSVNEILEKTVALTEKSIKLAHAELWDELVANETERQSQVAEFEPLLDDLDSLSDNSRGKLEQLIALNESLAKICSDRREELAASIKQMSTGRHANKAYRE